MYFFPHSAWCVWELSILLPCIRYLYHFSEEYLFLWMNMSQSYISIHLMMDIWNVFNLGTITNKAATSKSLLWAYALKIPFTFFKFFNTNLLWMDVTFTKTIYWRVTSSPLIVSCQDIRNISHRCIFDYPIWSTQQLYEVLYDYYFHMTLANWPSKRESAQGQTGRPVVATGLKRRPHPTPPRSCIPNCRPTPSVFLITSVCLLTGLETNIQAGLPHGIIYWSASLGQKLLHQGSRAYNLEGEEIC